MLIMVSATALAVLLERIEPGRAGFTPNRLTLLHRCLCLPNTVSTSQFPHGSLIDYRRAFINRYRLSTPFAVLTPCDSVCDPDADAGIACHRWPCRVPHSGISTRGLTGQLIMSPTPLICLGLQSATSAMQTKSMVSDGTVRFDSSAVVPWQVGEPVGLIGLPSTITTKLTTDSRWMNPELFKCGPQ